MTFTIGDSVRIREDLIAGEIYGKAFCEVARIPFFGKYAAITDVFKMGTLELYFLSADCGKRGWPAEMLEPAGNDGKEYSGLLEEE